MVCYFPNAFILFFSSYINDLQKFLRTEIFEELIFAIDDLIRYNKTLLFPKNFYKMPM